MLDLSVRPALDPVHDTQATFRVLLQALARPGTILRLPVRAEGAPGNPWLMASLLTLLDGDTAFCAEPVADSMSQVRFVRQRTGATLAAVESADFVVATGSELAADLTRRIRIGSLVYPDAGATLLVTVRELGLKREGAVALRLEGPGALPPVSLSMVGLSAGFFETRADIVSVYPRGFELYLIDDDGRIAGIPRSTHVEILARGTA